MIRALSMIHTFANIVYLLTDALTFIVWIEFLRFSFTRKYTQTYANARTRTRKHTRTRTRKRTRKRTLS